MYAWGKQWHTSGRSPDCQALPFSCLMSHNTSHTYDVAVMLHAGLYTHTHTQTAHLLIPSLSELLCAVHCKAVCNEKKTTSNYMAALRAAAGLMTHLLKHLQTKLLRARLSKLRDIDAAIINCKLRFFKQWQGLSLASQRRPPSFRSSLVLIGC